MLMQREGEVKSREEESAQKPVACPPHAQTLVTLHPAVLGMPGTGGSGRLGSSWSGAILGRKGGFSPLTKQPKPSTRIPEAIPAR